MIEKYFREELEYLREAGREFARAYPERARYLRIEDIDDRDPYVERLFEGFAFLTGRIRQKLDDELPEVTKSLLSLLWPHFLRPIPSLSILEFHPKPGRIQMMQVIRRNTEVDSVSVKGGIGCRFRTCYDVPIRPITLEEVILRPSDDGNSVICFRFRMEEGVDYHNLGFDKPLRLFIHDLDDSIKYALHLFLTHNVGNVVIQAYGDAASAVKLPGQTGVQPVGFAPEDGLPPYTDYSFLGYRLLQEYFAYRDKFFFFDINGLDKLQPPEGMEVFEVQVFFNRRFPEGSRLRAENFRLHCTPIINLFSGDAEPIRVNYLDAEYRVIADVRYPGSIEVYSVDAVEGIVTGTEERHTYVPFYSFKHGLEQEGRQKKRYYHTSTRPRITRRDLTPDFISLGLSQKEEFGGLDTYISLVSADARAEGPMEETLSLEVTCTNGRWPRELDLGDICYPTPSVPEFVTFSNIQKPTLPIYPPLQEQHFEWNLISHLGLNYLSLADAAALRGLLELYKWDKTDEPNRRRIMGIRNVSFKPKERIYRGSVIRGISVTLVVERENFEFKEGDLHLFGLVMSEFFSLYASINSFVQLTLECPSGERFEWPPKTGRSHLI